jgi:dihydrofolate reductase
VREVVAIENVTLDGFVDSNDGTGFEWTYPGYSDEVDRFGNEHVRADVDMAMYGRRTYLGMQAYWSDEPTDSQEWGEMTPVRDMPDLRPGTQAHFEWVNNVDKIVFSTTLTSADWRNSRLVVDHVAEEVSALKQTPGGTMAVYASPKLVHSLIRMDLVDEFRVIVHPITVGSGTALFPEKARLDLDLLESKVFNTGAVYLRYRVTKGEEGEH